MTNSADPDQLASSDLDLHCLLRQDMLYSAREGLKLSLLKRGTLLKDFPSKEDPFQERGKQSVDRVASL